MNFCAGCCVDSFGKADISLVGISEEEIAAQGPEVRVKEYSAVAWSAKARGHCQPAYRRGAPTPHFPAPYAAPAGDPPAYEQR